MRHRAHRAGGRLEDPVSALARFHSALAKDMGRSVPHRREVALSVALGQQR